MCFIQKNMNNNTETEESIIQLLHSDDVDDVALGIIIAVRLYGRNWFPNTGVQDEPLPDNTIMTKRSQPINRNGIAMVFPDGEYIYACNFFEYIPANHPSFTSYIAFAQHKYEYGE
jgi:hypothetical protein